MVANVGTLVGMIKQVQSTTLQTGTTTDGVPEGSSNLYFTAARGRSGCMWARTALGHHHRYRTDVVLFQ